MDKGLDQKETFKFVTYFTWCFCTGWLQSTHSLMLWVLHDV